MAQTKLGNEFLAYWYKYGVVVEKYEIANSTDAVLFISVPERSVLTDSRNTEMAGNYLAKQFKNALPTNGTFKAEVRAKIRKNEYWTHDMSSKAEIKIRMKLLLSKSAI